MKFEYHEYRRIDLGLMGGYWLWSLDSWWSRQWNIECALCILVPANKSVSDAILSATGRVKSIDGNPNNLWSFLAQALRQLKTLQLEKLSQTIAKQSYYWESITGGRTVWRWCITNSRYHVLKIAKHQLSDVCNQI